MRGVAVGRRIGFDRIPRVGPAVVGIRPLRRIRLADRGVERVVRILGLRAISRILAWRLREAARRFLVRFIWHAAKFPAGLPGLTIG
jgi:hypothetical protein